MAGSPRSTGDFELHPGEIVGYLGPNGSGRARPSTWSSACWNRVPARSRWTALLSAADPIAYKRRIGDSTRGAKSLCASDRLGDLTLIGPPGDPLEDARGARIHELLRCFSFATAAISR